jgi:Tol biopolymer transport system component
VVRPLRVLPALIVGLVALGAAGPAWGAFPGQNGRIAFTTDRDGNEEIYSIRPDSSDPRNLTNHPANDFLPAYSPDGRSIAFSSDRDEQPEIYVMRADGSRQTRITFSPGTFDVDPAWSPDGKQLVFVNATLPPSPDAPGGNGDLYVIDVRHGRAHGPARNVTRSPEADDFEPTWSPDGRRIAFDSNAADPENIDVYDIRPNGRDQRRLTDAERFDGGPNYSPDGRRIAFDSERNGNPDVFVMSAWGANETPLEVNPAVDILTGFSPDGRFITFTSDRDGAPACGDHTPDWQPRDSHHHGHGDDKHDDD